ncbi:hypothetical protein BU15DRAFT_70053 [Melanogaster broomeanus]|nr:hypothetical protein BU15DRAFT_70053 [Melanogaster broomeanus]
MFSVDNKLRVPDNIMEDEEELLSILQAHGQQFLSSFDISTPSKRRTRAVRNEDTNLKRWKHSATEDPESDEEWKGFNSPGNTESGGLWMGSTEENDDGSEQEDDGFTASSSRTPDVIVFSESRPKPAESNVSSRELRRSFMSSKVTNVTFSSTAKASEKMKSNKELEDDHTNAQNDALLHRLVHTKLLSGSLNPELNLDHAQREKALSGRILELAGSAKLGKGENTVREEERNKAAKGVREGLLAEKARARTEDPRSGNITAPQL